MIPALKEVQAAVKRIAPHVHNTPVLTSTTIDKMLKATVFFKCENFQRGGAFKIRGACNAILQLSEDERAAIMSLTERERRIVFGNEELGAFCPFINDDCEGENCELWLFAEDVDNYIGVCSFYAIGTGFKLLRSLLGGGAETKKGKKKLTQGE